MYGKSRTGTDTELILDLHRVVTDGTLENPDAAEDFKQAKRSGYVCLITEAARYCTHPPPANQLPDRLQALVPLPRGTRGFRILYIRDKAIILHFWIGFDHPFEDGNGRLARALFYWSMLRQKYWLFEFLSISKNIKKAPARYGYAYLYAETDENDLTYFVIQQLQIIIASIADLDSYLQKKIKQVASLEDKLKTIGSFNHRQMALLGHAIRGHSDGYTIESHKRSHVIAYATARADLLELENMHCVQGKRKKQGHVVLSGGKFE